MGWTVYYSGTADSAITDDERAILARHVTTWAAKLDDGSEAYAWDEQNGGTKLAGYTKVQFSNDSQADFETIVLAAQELETLLPRFRFLISDDYVVEAKTKPSDVEL